MADTPGCCSVWDTPAFARARAPLSRWGERNTAQQKFMSAGTLFGNRVFVAVVGEGSREIPLG